MTVLSGWQKRFGMELREARREDPVGLAALLVLLALVLLALLAPIIAPQYPYDLSRLNILENRVPPGTRSVDGITYWLGTDDQGRDLLSAIFYGLRTSLQVAGAATIIAMIVGVAAGLAAAWKRGWADSLIMRIVDLQLSFPAILLALILVTILGTGTDKVIIALAAVQWSYYARTARAAAMVERNKDYVAAARGLRIGSTRILFGHILPNCLAPLIVVATMQVAHAVALEATLSFLGLGLPITEPSLGLLIANGFQYLLSGQYWISIFPGLALVATILSINLVGDFLDTRLNPRLRR